jgi:hypothetical protein
VTKTLPTKAIFFLSDDLREEARGKMTLVGLYPDNKMYVELTTPGTLPAGLVAVLGQLTVSCVMFGGAGRLPMEADIQAPTGQLIAKLANDQDFNANGTSTLAFRGTSVAVPAYGVYRCRVKVDTKEFLYEFEILAGPPPGLGTTTQPAPSAKKLPRTRRRASSHKSVAGGSKRSR